MSGAEVKLYLHDMIYGHNYNKNWPRILRSKILHTSIVVYDKEYSYNGDVEIRKVGPQIKTKNFLSLGYTDIPENRLDQYVEDIKPSWNSKYNLTRHNCQHFCRNLAKFLQVETATVDEMINAHVRYVSVVRRSFWGTILGGIFSLSCLVILEEKRIRISNFTAVGSILRFQKNDEVRS